MRTRRSDEVRTRRSSELRTRRSDEVRTRRSDEVRTRRSDEVRTRGSSEVRSRRSGLPRGPQALPREQVATDQRARLFEAMIRCVDERGFVATTIAHLVERAGVSRRTFYEHFENKEQCLLQTYDMIFDELVAGIRGASERRMTWLERAEALLEAIFAVTVRRPDAARLVCVELPAAGPLGMERWAQGVATLTRLIGDELSAASGEDGGRRAETGVPDPVARAIVGALRRILYASVRRRRSPRTLRAQLAKALPELMTWIGSYYPSPPIREVPAAMTPLRPRGGRAPGTLSLSPSWSQRGLPRGEHNLPRGFVAHHQRERIFDAIARRTAAAGYAELGLDDIVADACVSLQTFYEHFENKEEAFLATYEVGHAKAVAAVRRALDLRLEWTANVKLGVAALLDFLASEPAFARLACVDILVAYPHVAERFDAANWSFAELLDLRADASTPRRMPSTLAGEAIVGGIFELLHDYILRGLTARLPELTEHATYIALAPLIGAEAAWAAATAD